jgi:hypothetical protein
MFEIPGLSDYSMAEIYKEYKKTRICINNVVKPYVFSDKFKKEHTPIIIYESSDYLPQFSNWSIYDKLQIQNNFMKYTYCEMCDYDNYILITGTLLIGSIYSILFMIDEVMKTANKECKVKLDLTITANKKMIFRMQERWMKTDYFILETYYLEKNKEHKIRYDFNSINDTEINKFTNRFLELFTSDNAKSAMPFLTTTIEETKKYCNSLLNFDKYLDIEN